MHCTCWSLRPQMAVHSPLFGTCSHLPSLFFFLDIHVTVAAGRNNATASCQACNAGETVQAFCVDHPDVDGCQQRMFACASVVLQFLPPPPTHRQRYMQTFDSKPSSHCPPPPHPLSRPQNGMDATRFAPKQRAPAMATAPGSHSTALEGGGGHHRPHRLDVLLGQPCKASAKRKGPASPLLTSLAIMLR
jgi:hypothetical protein